MYDMDSLDAGQEPEGRHGGKLRPRKHGDDVVNDSSLDMLLVRRSTTSQRSHHGSNPITYPQMLDNMLFEASSSLQKSPSPSGIGEMPLSSQFTALNVTPVDIALGPRLPIPPHLYLATSTPGLGIPNRQTLLCAASVNTSAGMSGLLAELLPNSSGDLATKIRRSTLFPQAGTHLSMMNPFLMNCLSPSLLFNRLRVPGPDVSSLDGIVASGLTTEALSRQFPNALPSLQYASDILRSLDLPSSFRPSPRTHFDSSGSKMADSFQVGDDTHQVGGHEFFPFILHRALAELESVAGGTDIAAFLPHGRSFQIKDQSRFEEKVLPTFFPRMKGFPSFQRQLNLYKFRRLGGSGLDRRSYSHELFVRHQPQLSRRMRRTRVKRCLRTLTSEDST